MTDISFRSATAVATMLARREISSVELTRMQLDRIAGVNPAINAVVELNPEAALAAAAAADRAIASSNTVGPLHGVPMTIKDSFNATDLHTTWGNPAFSDFVADTDATIVSRLKQAGAVVIGKTNVHFMLSDFGQTANELYGVTNNPWDTSRTPGGSSGGGAAALAAGLTYLEYGSDLVGSIRIPASFCGVYGIKPTAGIVPLTGFAVPYTPPGPRSMTYLSAVGPLARSVADLRTALVATAGPEEPDATGYTWSLAPPRHRRLQDFRVGVVLDDEAAPVSSEVGKALSNAVDAVAAAGAKIVIGWPEDLDPQQQSDAFGFQVGLFFAFAEGGSDFATLTEVVQQEAKRLAARQSWDRYFSDVDVFLCPSNFTPAFPHDTRPFSDRMISTPEGDRPYDSQPFWISHASLAGLPAVSAPIGNTAGGLPVGAQIIGPRYEDDTAMTFAELLADVVGGYQRPPSR
ncbi:MAG: amidase family protein [Nakamurella sp.]